MRPSSSFQCALALLLCLIAPAAANAYSTPDAFSDSPSSGGGGGRWFTGSPADGFGCSVCHERTAGAKTFPLLVAGLALDGYEPAESREVVLKWPEFSKRWRELRPDPTQPTPEGADSPSIGLVAEFVAESGKASGTVEIRGGSAGAAERCEVTRPNLKTRIAARLYQVRPGLAPISIKADRNGTLRCESRQLGQRCVIALKSCGAEEVRVVWKAPPSQEGPIWFSAGFVASEALSGTPENDSVFEVAMPMNQLDSSSATYTQNLRNACSVTRVGSRGSDGLWFGVLLVLGTLCARRNTRKGTLVIATLVAVSACGIEPSDHDPSEYPQAGLYTPGSGIGASDPTDTPDPSIVYSNRCQSPMIAAGPATNGTLDVSYTTQTIMGRYAPKNVSAVWIETIDEQFVANLAIKADLRRPGLVYWQERGCTEQDGPDAVTSETLTEHITHDNVSWSGVDLNGVPVPDGDYQLLIEVTEDDKEPGDFSTFRFTKGPMAFDRDETPTIDLLQAVHLTWTVTP